jgi:alpha-beta hydrolase superfamily lysophospholipase
MLGHSLGGLITLKLSIRAEGEFDGMGLLAPYIGIPYQKYIDKYIDSFIPYIDHFTKAYPYVKLGPLPISALPIKKHILELCKDPLLEVKSVAIRNIVLNKEAMTKFHGEEVQNITTPFIMILGGKEQITDNEAAKKFFEMVNVDDKKLIVYDELDHFVMHDNEFLSMLSDELIGWFDSKLVYAV